jgi:hypothetical protein
VQNNFNANPVVSQNLNLLRQGNSKVESGNLLTLPVGSGLLYVQPVYVRGAGVTSYPLLQKVLVSFGDKIGFADTLDQALDQVFGGDSGASAGDAGTPGAGGGGTGGTAGGGATQTPQERLRQALGEAQQAIADGQAALAKQDFTAYGQAQQRLQRALQRAVEAEAAVRRSSTASPSPSASPTGTPAPASTAATTRTPGTNRPRKTVFGPWRSKKRSPRTSACARKTANGPRWVSTARPPRRPSQYPSVSPLTAAASATAITSGSERRPVPARTPAVSREVSPGRGAPADSPKISAKRTG